MRAHRIWTKLLFSRGATNALNATKRGHAAALADGSVDGCWPLGGHLFVPRVDIALAREQLLAYRSSGSSVIGPDVVRRSIGYLNCCARNTSSSWLKNRFLIDETPRGDASRISAGMKIEAASLNRLIK